MQYTHKNRFQYVICSSYVSYARQNSPRTPCPFSVRLGSACTAGSRKVAPGSRQHSPHTLYPQPTWAEITSCLATHYLSPPFVSCLYIWKKSLTCKNVKMSITEQQQKLFRWRKGIASLHYNPSYISALKIVQFAIPPIMDYSTSVQLCLHTQPTKIFTVYWGRLMRCYSQH
jgi:hypothetical protein